jgi:four helix bundle protein
MYHKFYEMEIWKERFGLQKEIFELTRSFPKDEKYGLISQINDSSNSVIANIAESHGRYHFADKIRVLYIVRGEIEETQSHLLVASSRNYCLREQSVLIINKYEKLKMKLNSYISSISNQRISNQ